MSNFDDRLLTMIDGIAAKLGPVTTVLDKLITRLAPQTFASAGPCGANYFCGIECSGACFEGGTLTSYEFYVCGFNPTCSSTFTVLIGCGLDCQ